MASSMPTFPIWLTRGLGSSSGLGGRRAARRADQATSKSSGPDKLLKSRSGRFRFARIARLIAAHSMPEASSRSRMSRTRFSAASYRSDAHAFSIFIVLRISARADSISSMSTTFETIAWTSRRSASIAAAASSRSDSIDASSSRFASSCFLLSAISALAA